MSGPMNALHRRESTLYTFQHLIFQYLRSVKINNTSHRLETCLHTQNHVHHHRRNAWSYACKIQKSPTAPHVGGLKYGQVANYVLLNILQRRWTPIRRRPTRLTRSSLPITRRRHQRTRIISVPRQVPISLPPPWNRILTNPPK